MLAEGVSVVRGRWCEFFPSLCVRACEFWARAYGFDSSDPVIADLVGRAVGYARDRSPTHPPSHQTTAEADGVYSTEVASSWFRLRMIELVSGAVGRVEGPGSLRSSGSMLGEFARTHDVTPIDRVAARVAPVG